MQLHVSAENAKAIRLKEIEDRKMILLRMKCSTHDCSLKCSQMAGMKCGHIMCYTCIRRIVMNRYNLKSIKAACKQKCPNC